MVAAAPIPCRFLERIAEEVGLVWMGGGGAGRSGNAPVGAEERFLKVGPRVTGHASLQF